MFQESLKTCQSFLKIAEAFGLPLINVGMFQFVKCYENVYTSSQMFQESLKKCQSFLKIVEAFSLCLINVGNFNLQHIEIYIMKILQ